jgi:hypothetical protein
LSGCAPPERVANDPLCLAVLEALPKSYGGGRSCEAVPEGVVIGSRDEARHIVPLLTRANAIYRRYLGGTPARVAYLIGSEMPEGARDAAKHRDAVIINWPSMRGQRETFAKAMRKEVDNNFSHAPQNVRDEMLNKMMAGFQNQISSNGVPSPFEAGTIQHELGHLWFASTYVSEGSQDTQELARSGNQYGTSAPDWLDEASAIVLETDYLTNVRRKRVADTVGSGNDELIPSLLELTSMTHPVLSVDRELIPMHEGSNISIGVNIRPDRKISGDARDSGWFYAMVRAFVDFLIDNSGDPLVLKSIASELAKGASLSDWLASSPHREDFGGSVDEMDRMWRAWLRSYREYN